MFNTSIFNFEKILIKIGFKKPSKPVNPKVPTAIHASSLRGATIEGNKTYGASLVEADEIIDSSIKNNETHL